MKNTRLRFAWLALLLAGLAPMLAAQSATNTPPPQPDRWLFIVDTSSAMDRRAKAAEGIVGELLASGMRGQMRAGDDIGFWTFSKELRAGDVPLQSWQPGKSNIIASRTVAFLAQQAHKGKSRLEPVMEELARVVADSRRLTILLLSDGTGKIAGTPYDEAINAAYAKCKSESSRAHAPIVTVLRTQNGKYVGQSVSFAPWPIEFPPFPDLGPAAQPAQAATAKPATTAKPIIIKPEPKKPEPVAPAPKLMAPVETVAPLPIKAAEPAPAVVPVAPPTLLKPVETAVVTPVPPPPAPAPAPVEVARVEPPPVKSAPVVSPAAPAVATPVASVPAGTFTARKWPLILGIGCMWGAIVIALVLARRARRSHASSIITRSLDQREK